VSSGFTAIDRDPALVCGSVGPTALAATCRSVRSERWLQKGATGDWLAAFAKLSWRPTKTTRSSAFTQTWHKSSVGRVSSPEKNADNSFEVIYVSK
jgi:hypothetical protein